MRQGSRQVRHPVTFAGAVGRRPEKTVTLLEAALFSRSDIDMAKGALIALHGCDPGGAFARLVDESQRRNIKLRDVALEMLDRMQTKS